MRMRSSVLAIALVGKGIRVGINLQEEPGQDLGQPPAVGAVNCVDGSGFVSSAKAVELLPPGFPYEPSVPHEPKRVDPQGATKVSCRRT